MKAEFLNSCYKVASLSTCILNEKENPDWEYGATSQIKITDNLTAVTKYEPVISDYISASEYEVHIFSIDFIRGNEFLHGFSYERKLNKTLDGSLANPDLPLDKKLTTLKTLQPGLRGKIQSLKATSLLTKEEELALISKGVELQDEAERKLETYNLVQSKEETEEKVTSTQK